MNDDLVVQKILKLLENNTAFIGYALNGGIGTKINVKNTETGKTIQALSINVDSSGEVLVVKDSDDGKYKAVTFKAAQQTTERIIQIRKTKPVDDKKIIEYTDSDIEVFYLFVKLIDTGSPVPTQLQSTWIRKGSSCTQFVGAYERCNYAAKETIGGTSYTGLPYKPYNSLNECLNDDLGRDAKTPHGTSDENGIGLGWRIYSTKLTGAAEESLRNALESHDGYYGTNYKKLFGYGSILECSGAMYIQGWEVVRGNSTPEQQAAGELGTPFFQCEFSYLPGYTSDCTLQMQNAGYCDTRGFISSKAPLFGYEEPGQPSVGGVDNSYGFLYGWDKLPYEFKYKRHFPYQYVNGSNSKGSFLIFEGLTDDQNPTIPEGFYLWTPGCPSNLGNGGPYDGSGGNRFPDGPPKPRKRDMKLSTHKAEIWLGSSKREEAIKLYELGASDLFSGMYNAFIIRANETQVDIENRLKRGFVPSQEDVFIDEKFYENRDKNRIDLNINPRVWVYIVDNIPKTSTQNSFDNYFTDPTNSTLHRAINNLYNKTINLSIVDNKTQVIHLKLGLTSRSTLSNTDCKGTYNSSYGVRDLTKITSSQSWEYQKYVTITVKNWSIQSTTNSLDTALLESENTWNTDYIKRKFYTSFGGFDTNQSFRDTTDQILLRHDANTNIEKIVTDNHFEQFNYSLKFLLPTQNYEAGNLYFSGLKTIPKLTYYDDFRYYVLSSKSWWELWGKGIYDKKTKRLSSIVGYEKNYYQVVRNFGTGANLSYGSSGIDNRVLSSESFFDYLTTRPKVFIPSVIKLLRTDSTKTYYYALKDRKKVLEQVGTLFYFAEIKSRWCELTNTPLFITLPSSYYSAGYVGETLTHYIPLQANARNDNTFLRIMDTRQWLQNLWAQLVYDSKVTVDVDSYKEVTFTEPTDPTKYKKFSLYEEGVNSNYPFSTAVNNKPFVELETVLTPGVLDVTKQVPIKKPTNVELDPNMSFLVYIYPFVSVTKKTKEI